MRRPDAAADLPVLIRFYFNQSCKIHIQMYFLYYVFVQLYTGMVELTEYTIQVYNNCAHHARMKCTIQC